MGKSGLSQKLNVANDQSPGRIRQNLDQMTATFPECPICKATAQYKISGIAKNIVVCEGCNAGWTSHEFYEDFPFRSLALAKKGSHKELKPLLNKFRSVEFWMRFDLETFENDLIEDLLNLYTGPDLEKRKESRQKLTNSDEVGQIEIRDIACGLQKSQNRIGALMYLASIESESDLPLLIQSLYDDNGKYTWELVRMLSRLARDAGFSSAIPPIIQVLKEFESARMRARAAEVLGDIPGNPQVVNALAESLYDTGSLPQEQILAGSLEGFLIAAAKQKLPPTVREFAFQSLIKIGDPLAAEALVDFELSGGFGLKIEVEAEFLKPLGNVVVKPLIKGLSDENQRKRARSAGFLCFLGNKDAVDALIASLSDEIVLVRSNAAYALSIIGDTRAVEPLKQLDNDPEDKVKLAAEIALKKLDSR